MIERLSNAESGLANGAAVVGVTGPLPLRFNSISIFDFLPNFA